MISVINPYQHVLLNTFDGGEFAHLVKRPGPHVEMDDILNCGNLGLIMMFKELSTFEGCDSKALADARLGKVVYQFNEVRDALHKVVLTEDYIGDLNSEDQTKRRIAKSKQMMAHSTFGARADKGDGIYNAVDGPAPIDTVKNVVQGDGMGEVVDKKESP